MTSKDEPSALDKALGVDNSGDKAGFDPDKDPDSSKPPSERSGIFAGVAVMLALAALALSGLLWLEAHDGGDQSGQQLEASLQRLQENQSRQSQALSGLEQRLQGMSAGISQDDIGGLESGIADQATRISSLEEALGNQSNHARSLQQAIDSLQARLRVAESGLAATTPSLDNAPARLDLATVEYLLRLAPERLMLFHDVRAADQALIQADSQLAAMDNPIYIGLRRHIADARQELANTQLPNAIEISARLDDAQNQLASLTFGGESNAAAQSASSHGESSQAEAGWWDRLKASLSSLVTVRRSAADSSERLTIEDKDLLRQGLWMQIEGARLALMRNDQASWRDTLARAEQVLERWFDESTSEYIALHGELDALADVSISPELPDISGPWAQLQLIRQTTGQPAGISRTTQDSAQEVTTRNSEEASSEVIEDEAGSESTTSPAPVPEPTPESDSENTDGPSPDLIQADEAATESGQVDDS